VPFVIQEMKRRIQALEVARKALPAGDPVDAAYRRLRYGR
jgi:hypothetical protein